MTCPSARASYCRLCDADIIRNRAKWCRRVRLRRNARSSRHSSGLTRMSWFESTADLIRVNFGLPSGVIGVWTRRLVAEHAP